ncbi:hypothetical protein DM01DRAFT_1161328 [Hesseltinella vesiculosa]|uniref:N-acetyltransferase domain-containing protein n=1 Tax=Hesseltinella vesiculosa TaxID=101127 RepID=A0A1X2GSQ5_9FUNG|nr:hypothetical protein DM01DRAFT_1161328 [Hesseltinella vesiculosa]
MSLHLFSPDQYPQLTEQLLAHHQPINTPFLGWFLLTGRYEADHLGRAKLYSSHPDPNYLPIDDPVVLVTNSFHRLRIFVSTEAYLNQYKFSDEILQCADESNWATKAPLLFPDDAERQALYEKSVAVLEPILLKAMEDMEIFIHGASLLWSPLLNSIFNIGFQAPCKTFYKPVSSVGEPEATKYTVDVVTDQDVEEVVKRNKIDYDPIYVKDCCKYSVALRDGDKLIAWAFTHRDMPIGGLHVIPEYRRQGLASVVMSHLTDKHAKLYRSVYPGRNTFVSAIIEVTNPASMALFTSLGFENTGLGVCWTLCKSRDASSEFLPRTK